MTSPDNLQNLLLCQPFQLNIDADQQPTFLEALCIVWDCTQAFLRCDFGDELYDARFLFGLSYFGLVADHLTLHRVIDLITQARRERLSNIGGTCAFLVEDVFYAYVKWHTRHPCLSAPVGPVRTAAWSVCAAVLLIQIPTKY